MLSYIENILFIKSYEFNTRKNINAFFVKFQIELPLPISQNPTPVRNDSSQILVLCCFIVLSASCFVCVVSTFAIYVFSVMSLFNKYETHFLFIIYTCRYRIH